MALAEAEAEAVRLSSVNSSLPSSDPLKRLRSVLAERAALAPCAEALATPARPAALPLSVHGSKPVAVVVVFLVLALLAVLVAVPEAQSTVHLGRRLESLQQPELSALQGKVRTAAQRTRKDSPVNLAVAQEPAEETRPEALQAVVRSTEQAAAAEVLAEETRLPEELAVLANPTRWVAVVPAPQMRARLVLMVPRTHPSHAVTAALEPVVAVSRVPVSTLLRLAVVLAELRAAVAVGVPVSATIRQPIRPVRAAMAASV